MWREIVRVRVSLCPLKYKFQQLLALTTSKANIPNQYQNYKLDVAIVYSPLAGLLLNTNVVLRNATYIL